MNVDVSTRNTGATSRNAVSLRSTNAPVGTILDNEGIMAVDVSAMFNPYKHGGVAAEFWHKFHTEYR
jgi:hypothetical protein